MSRASKGSGRTHPCPRRFPREQCPCRPALPPNKPSPPPQSWRTPRGRAHGWPREMMGAEPTLLLPKGRGGLHPGPFRAGPRSHGRDALHHSLSAASYDPSPHHLSRILTPLAPLQGPHPRVLVLPQALAPLPGRAGSGSRTADPLGSQPVPALVTWGERAQQGRLVDLGGKVWHIAAPEPFCPLLFLGYRAHPY